MVALAIWRISAADNIGAGMLMSIADLVGGDDFWLDGGRGGFVFELGLNKLAMQKLDIAAETFENTCRWNKRLALSFETRHGNSEKIRK